MQGTRLDEQLENRLNTLVAKTYRSKSFLAKEALTRYTENEGRKQSENELAMACWGNTKNPVTSLIMKL